jgi:MinD-like ATPase involved in chromosome partitioning or flagellar assembly
MGGLAEVVVVGSRLPRLDLNVVATLAAAGVHIIGVAADEVSASRLRTLGVTYVVNVDVAELDFAVHSIAALAGEMRVADLPVAHDVRPEPSPATGGRITVIVGASGAPGRTTVAANLATSWAGAGRSTLLVDADTDAPVLASVLGVMTDEAGLARAARAALEARDDAQVLQRAVSRLGANLALLSGATGGATEVSRPSAIERVVTIASNQFEHVVVDTSPWRLGDMQLGGSNAGQPLRTLMGLADSLVIVGAADPIGLVRLMNVLTSTQHEAPQARHFVVLNKARSSALGGAESEVTDMLGQHVALPETLVIADDRAAADNALLRGQALVTVAPKSKAAQGIRQLAAALQPPQTARSAPAESRVPSEWFGLRAIVARRAG